MKRFDLMMGINTRGQLHGGRKYCIPHLKKAANPHYPDGCRRRST